MKYYGDEGKSSPAAILEHHGVKGMKWGVHNQKKLDRYNRLASGTGNARDHIHLVRTVTPIELAKAKGSFKGVAVNRASALQARKDRFAAGNPNFRDKADRVLSTPLHQLVRGK